jgi:hypothetical protein
MQGLDDFLILETRIRERIEAQVPELARNVRLVNDPDDVTQRVASAVAWISPGITQMETDKSGRALDCNQRWNIVLTLRNVSQQPDRRIARAQAGPLIAALLGALSGWHPGSPFGLLRAVTPPSGPFVENGVFFYPLEFETRFAYQATTPLEKQA